MEPSLERSTMLIVISPCRCNHDTTEFTMFSDDERCYDRDRVIELGKIEKRYRLAFREVASPPLSISDIDALRRWDEGGPTVGDPKNELIQRCSGHKHSMECMWHWERAWAEDYPDRLPYRDPPDTASCDDLIARIRGWTMLECLKVLKIFDDFNAIHCSVVDLTSEVIHTILAGATKPQVAPSTSTLPEIGVDRSRRDPDTSGTHT